MSGALNYGNFYRHSATMLLVSAVPPSPDDLSP
ncbi:hypothetical protein J2793_005069 [Paraburkholderia caledonica]|uniref:Uncharacterized protein n=1 Tax=Paraburkholderia caledonica TaxID=134536 RepID=A0AB73IJR4_9BURK|nr:hypothetical protein [Paraburkholderia caledonica]